MLAIFTKERSMIKQDSGSYASLYRWIRLCEFTISFKALKVILLKKPLLTEMR